MIGVGRYRFDGPFYDVSSLRPLAGIYVVLDKRNHGLFVLDIGESENLRMRIGNHDRRDCWERAQIGMLAFACLYLPTSDRAQRLSIEGELRTQFNPTCGDR